MLRSTGLLMFAAALLVGCKTYHNLPETIGNDTTAIDAIMRQVDHGTTHSVSAIPEAPVTIRNLKSLQSVSYRELTLREAIEHAMSSARVLRDLGGTVLRVPQAIASGETKGLQETNPQESIEAALAAFDAQFYALGKWQNNDRRFNNRFFGGGANAFKQDTHDYVFQISKRTTTGAEFAVRSVTDYDANNATGNRVPSAWQTQLHAEARQPLLQGGGMTFNRIAGPAARPGVYNGVLIAKVNNDITNAEFQLRARDYVSNVINAYWDLYFAYRDLDAKKQALERSRLTWKSYEAQKTSNRASGTNEALAREQFFRFQSELHDAIAGKTAQRTQVNNASAGGAFTGIGGVQAAERRLRLLIGMPLNDQSLLRPADEPIVAPIIYDWESIAIEATMLRGELEQQRLRLKRREMEVLAAKNFLMPSLDLVAIYRLRGLDQQLAGHDSAFEDLASMDLQELEGSLEMRLPIGFRQGHLAVRHAKLQVARARALLEEQRRQVLHDLSNAVGESDRAFVQVETNLNRYLAASDALAALEANRKAGMPVNLEQLLDAQRRVGEAQTKYFMSAVEYTLAIKNVHFEKGTLLESIDLFILTEDEPMRTTHSPPPLPQESVEPKDDEEANRVPGEAEVTREIDSQINAAEEDTMALPDDEDSEMRLQLRN